jgi:hypothetical protein
MALNFRRRRIRLPRTSYIGTQWYFLTTCTLDRVPRFDVDLLSSESLRDPFRRREILDARETLYAA